MPLLHPSRLTWPVITLLALACGGTVEPVASTAELIEPAAPSRSEIELKLEGYTS